MSGKNELFDIIKSMNKNEKRYFRMFASMQKGSKKYLALFDSFDKQKNYADKDIKKTIKDEKLLRHYAFYKNYLKSLILKSLVIYNSNNISDIKIQNMITAAKILFAKALYSQYFKTLGAAKKLALKNERFGYLLEILGMEKYIIKKHELHYKKSVEIYETAFMSIKKLNNYFKYSKITSYVIYKYRDIGIRRESKHYAEYKRQLNTGIMVNPQKALCARSLENYYRIKEIENTAKGNYSEAYNAVKKRREVLINNPGAFRDNIIDFNIDTLSGLIDMCIRLNKIKEAEEYLNLLVLNRKPNRADNEDIMVNSSFYKFQMLLKSNDTELIKSHIKIIENLLVKYDNKLLIDTELYIRFCVVKGYIAIKKYDKALETINNLLTHKLLHKREDLRFYTILLNIVVHYELKNYGLLKHLVRSAFRFLSKHKRLYKTEKLVLKFFSKLPDPEKADKQHINDFIYQLETLKKQPYEQNAFEYFDFMEWAKSIKI